MDSPLAKKQKTHVSNESENSSTEESPDVTRASRSRTPRKLVLGSPDKRFAFSQPVSSSSSNVPHLQPLKNELSSSRGRVYSQSPPRSPNRSPTRKLELIQLSPMKKSRLESQKFQESRAMMGSIQRLCIDRLVLHNFKSYAGTQVVGPFHNSFSAVVGPNGSGKSNVIDSLLFVFGFRANKMRQGKLSELIHKSELHPDLDSCHVDIFFQYVQDEPDGTTSIIQQKPGMVIRRKAFRNNTSKYYLNGKESSYTIITQLLRDEGIDLDHKRFLILQGEVESIAQMKPKAEKESDDGLLEYLEDIIGTAQYKPLIENTLSEIAKLNDICEEKENRFEIVEREKSSLEQGKNEALEYLEKEKTLTILRSKLLQYHLWKNGQKLNSTKEKIAKAQDKLSAEKAKRTKHSEEMAAMKAELQSLKLILGDLGESEKKLTLEKRACDRDRVSLEEKLKNLTQKEVKSSRSLQSITSSITTTQAKMEELANDQEQHDKDLLELNGTMKEEKEKLDEIKSSLKDKISLISEQIREIEKELEPWNVKLQEKKAQVKLEETTISVFKESHAKIEQDIILVNKGIDELRNKMNEQRSSVFSLEKEQVDIRRQLTVGQSECDNAVKKIKEMKGILTAHRQRSIDARSSLSTFENKNKVLAALLRLQRSGRISGFHGRLGDLGTIDDKYDVAISTACPRLDDIVVETVECGQQCIEYLRKNKLGYARFILLDKLRNFNLSPIQTPENVPRLYDLVRPNNPKFRNAFYSVLRDTLVAKDLKEANKVAYGKQRYRVVTLDGKLIDLSGTMSGGGNFKARGMMKSEQQSNSAFTAEEVQQIDKELSEREHNFQIAADTLHEMEEALQKLKDREPEIELDISKRKLDIDSLSSEMKASEGRLEYLLQEKAQKESSNEELSTAEVKLKSLKSEYRELENEMQSKKKEMKVLQEQIMKVGGTKLQMQSSMVDSVNQRITIVLAKSKKTKTDLKKAQNDIKRYQKQAEQLAEELKSCSQEKTLIENNLDSSSKKVDELSESINKLKDELELTEERVRKAEESIDEKTVEGRDFEASEIECVAQLDKLKELFAILNKEAAEFLHSLNSLKIRDVTATLQALDETLENESKNEVPAETPGEEDGEHSSSLHDPMDVDENQVESTSTEAQLQAGEAERRDIEESLPNGLPKLLEDELENFEVESVELEIHQLQDYVENAYADIEILEEYARRLIEYKARKVDLNHAVQERDKVRQSNENLKKKRLDEFMEGFNAICMILKEMYQMITMGGNAELELVDSLDPFSEGVLFSVMPPKKSWRNISNLSGGEKTLSSLALVFALHKYKPTPLYVMDEIDAALDFRNVSIVANYIKERTKNAQFIVISLRNNMFELAKQLVGVYKNKNMTKSVALQNTDLIDRS